MNLGLTNRGTEFGLMNRIRGHPTPRPRSKGDTLFSCISNMWNVVTPMGSGFPVGQPQGRLNSPVGQG